LAATLKNARTDCSVPFCRGILAIDPKHKIGDLKLFEPKAMCPFIAVRDRQER
jgi:hypothetical protein